MRLESHWRILKKDYASHLIKPRLDVLSYIICTGLVPSRIHLYLQVEAGLAKPSINEDFVSLWRKCAGIIDDSVVEDRNNLYHTDRSRWCEAPPRCTPDLFQERLPLIRFDDFDLSRTRSVSPAEGSSNCVDYEPVVHSSNYLEELESLQLLPSEDPEANEENDERSLELLRIMQWAAGTACHSNPGMQRDLCCFIRNPNEFFARYKRPYEETLGRARSADSQTMRKAQKSYYFMRPQNHGQRSV